MNYKKTFIGGILAFIIGTSCCWLSSLAIWFGSAAFLGIVGSFIEDIQLLLIVLSLVLLLMSIFFYWRKMK